MIPTNCSDTLQPLDVGVNKSVKEFFCQKFHSWYAESISTQLNGTKAKDPVDLWLEHGISGETAILSPSVFVVSLTGRAKEDSTNFLVFSLSVIMRC